MKKKYISDEDKYNYGIDKIDVTLMTKRNVSLGSKISSNKRRVHKIKNTMKIEKRTNSFPQGIYFLKYNGNRMMREIAKKKYQSNWYTLSRSVFSQSDNFIPGGILLAMKDKEESFPLLRSEVLKEIWLIIEIERKYFAEMLSQYCETLVEPSDIDVYIQYAEINYDLVKGPGTALACIPEVHHQANNVANVGSGYYEGNKFLVCNFFELVLNHTATKKPALQIGAEIKEGIFTSELYIKEEGPYGCQNRFEYRFPKESLNAILGKGNRRIENFKEFKRSFFKLAEFTFDIAKKVLGSEEVKEERNWSLLEEVLKRIFRTTWFDLLPLIKEKEVIETGVDCSRIPKTCKVLIPKLEKHDILFKKVSRSQYKVHWSLLHKAHINYQKMKASESEKKYKKKAVKKWSTAGLSLENASNKKIH